MSKLRNVHKLKKKILNIGIVGLRDSLTLSIGTLISYSVENEWFKCIINILKSINYKRVTQSAIKLSIRFFFIIFLLYCSYQNIE